MAANEPKGEAQPRQQEHPVDAPGASVEPIDEESLQVARLKAQASGDLRRQKQLAFAAIAAAAAFLVLVYFPSVATIAQLHKRIDTDARRLQTDRQRSSALPQTRLAAARLGRELEQFKPFPDRPPLNELISETTNGLQLKLEALRCEPQPEMFDGPLGILPVRITFEGNFENACEFIRRCEQMPRPVRIHSMRIRQKPAPQTNAPPPVGQVTVELVLHAYFEAGKSAA